MRAFLDATFERLALSDPERHVRIAIARCPFDAIIASVAIFEAKQSTGSLPEGADGRYLLGIVRNVQEQREHELVADLLLRLRRQARDIALQRLCDERDALLASERPTNDVLSALVDRALLSESVLDRTIWLNALASFVGKARPANARPCIAAPRAASTPPFEQTLVYVSKLSAPFLNNCSRSPSIL